MDDPRLIFLNDVKLKQSRIINFSGSILFCGGPLNDITKPPISARDCIYRYLIDNSRNEIINRIITAEEIQDWLYFDIYPDLISFERDLANIASWVVLFVESPGSICELGAFCLAKEINHKLILFIRADVIDDASFIEYGPVNHLKGLGHDEHIHKYPWEVDKATGHIIGSSFKEISTDIIDDLQNLISSSPSSNIFKTEDDDITPGHTMILITDLIDICICLKAKEIKYYLEILKMSIPPDKLNKYLFILEKIGLIKKISYGDKYYVIKKPRDYIKYSLNSGQPYDRMRLKVDIQQYYTKEKPRRIRALKHFGIRI